MTPYEKAKNMFNKLMNANGCEKSTIGEKQSDSRTEKWNISDMVSECQRVLNDNYNSEAANKPRLIEKYGKEQAETLNDDWFKRNRKLKSFIKMYEEFAFMEKPTEKHGTKYDDALITA